MNKSLIWIAIVVVVVVGIFLLSGGKDTPAPVGETGNETEEATTLPATGNIDDAVNSLLSEAAADGAAPTETDPSLAAEDDWSGLDQTLDTSNVQ